MPIEVLMPALSPTMTEGKLAKWLKKEGDEVRAGDVIAEIETDKATMEFEAADDGRIGRLLVAEGSEGVPVNTPIALLIQNGEDADAVQAARPSTGPAQREPGTESVQEKPTPAPADMGYEADRGVTADAPVRVEIPKSERPPMEREFTGETVTLTVREALRDAMAEEMRRDESVFLMGEEVAEYQGAYKISQGLLQEFG